MSIAERLVRAMRDLNLALTASSAPEDVMAYTAEVAMKAVGAAGATIYLHDPEARLLLFAHALGGAPNSPTPATAFGLVGESLADDEGIAGAVFQSRSASVVNDATSDPHHAHRVDEGFGYETRNLATIPLCSPDGEAIGVLQVVNKAAGDFTDDDLTVLVVLAEASSLASALLS